MARKSQLIILLVFAITLGCKTTPRNQPSFEAISGSTEHLYQSLRPQTPTINVESEQKFDTGPLENFNFNDPTRFIRLSLDECIERALSDSKIIRELGGTVLRSPELIRSEDDPAITYTDPRQGEEAALSEFDANFSNQLLYQNNDRAFNSSFVGDQGILTQDLATNITNLSKRSATGGLFQLSHQVIYDRNNTPANRFANDSAYDTFLNAEVRQPLLQGSGALFNRIAGPNNLPGVNTGVLIARANSDISLADFELGIRNLVSDVENAYWDLYYAYRDLEAKIEARNGAFKIWESLKARGEEKGQAEILQAEEQYYLFASRVQDAIHGQLNDGTRTNNGSSSGTFRANSGVRTAERRLRLLTGHPVNDSSLLIPGDMPIEADVVFDWEQVKNDALAHRTELRRQRWVLKREELEYLANKNHLLPRLDLIGRYRIRGFGNDLFGNDGFDPTVAPGIDPQNDSDAFATFLNGDLQEWELGMDLNIPIGYRRQMAAVRNSELSYTREKKILMEQEREIIYGLSNSIGEIARTSSLLEVNTSRLDASKNQYRAIQEDYSSDDTTIDLVLESQRRVIEAKLDYFRSQVELMLAIKSVHFEKGTVLAYHNISLSEQGWPSVDMCQSNNRESNKSGVIDYFCPGIKTSEAYTSPGIGFATNDPVILSENEQDIQAEVEVARKILNQSGNEEAIAKVEDIGEGPQAGQSILMGIAKQMEEQMLAENADAPTFNLTDETPQGASPNMASDLVPTIDLTSKQPGQVGKEIPTQIIQRQTSSSAGSATAKVSSSATAGSGTAPQPNTAKLANSPASTLFNAKPSTAKFIVSDTQINRTPQQSKVAASNPQTTPKTQTPIAPNPAVKYRPPTMSPAAARMKNSVRSLYNPILNRPATKSLPPQNGPAVAKSSNLPKVAPKATNVEHIETPSSKPPQTRVSSLPSQSSSSRRR